MEKLNKFWVGLLIGVVASALVYLFQRQESQYEFHTGDGGKIMWQCNRATGEVKFQTVSNHQYVFFPSQNGEAIWRGDRYTGETKYESANVGQFEFWKGQYQDYVLNNKSGSIWRYYNGNTNGFPVEGFLPLDYGAPKIFGPNVSTNSIP